MPEELVRGQLRYPRDLIRVVDVGMETYLLPHADGCCQ